MCTRIGGRSSRPSTPAERAQRLGVDLVGVEPPQLLGQFLAERPPGQRQIPVALAGTAQHGRVVVAGQRDLVAVRRTISVTSRMRGNSVVISERRHDAEPGRRASPRISAAVGSDSGATTVADTTGDSIVSNAPATSVRHGVIRLQARSVSPGA